MPDTAYSQSIEVAPPQNKHNFANFSQNSQHKEKLGHHSAELQPAEHLWPLTNEALIHRCFANIDAYEFPQPNKHWNQSHSSLCACYTVEGSGVAYCIWMVGVMTGLPRLRGL